MYYTPVIPPIKPALLTDETEISNSRHKKRRRPRFEHSYIIITIQMAETKRKRNPFAMATTAPSVTPSRKNKGSPNARRVLFNSSAKTKVHQAVDMVSAMQMN
jgi:hypothetical protein